MRMLMVDMVGWSVGPLVGVKKKLEERDEERDDGWTHWLRATSSLRILFERQHQRTQINGSALALLSSVSIKSFIACVQEAFRSHVVDNWVIL
jgi:hypothetical protein